MADYYYLTSRNEVIDLHSDNIWSDEHWVYGYAYDSEVSNGYINNLTVPSVDKEVDVWFLSDSAYTTAQIRNSFYDAIDRDVKNKTPGRLYVGEYYLECYLVGIKNPEASIGHCKIHCTVKVLSGACTWVCEKDKQFVKVETDSSLSSGIDYPYDYPYDYQASMLVPTFIENPFADPCDFRIHIEGPCTNPYVIIAGHTYRMNCTLIADEHLYIDSKEKTIIKVGVDHAVLNYFGYRYKSESIFEPIPNGVSTFTWSGQFTIEFTLLDKRREPLFIEHEEEVIVPDGIEPESTSVYLTDEDGNCLTDEDGNLLVVEV